MLNSFRRRRKTGRNSTHNKHGPSSADTSVGFENDHRHTAKTYSPSTATKPPLSNSSSYYKQSNYSSNISSPSFGQDIPPALPPRKPLDKKNSVQLASTSSVFNDSLSQAPSSTYDDTTSNLLAPTRILPSKEISTSLVNLMGTATDSVSKNNGSSNNQQDSKLRKHSIFSILQRLPTSPAVPADQWSFLDPQSKVGATTGFLESPSSQRLASTNIPSSASYMKVANDFTWCHETNTQEDIENEIKTDEYEPKLETDDKPLIYRQQFLPTEHFNWYGISEAHGPVIISYRFSNDPDKSRTIMSICRTRQGTSIESLSDVHPSSTPLEILRRLCDQCTITDIEYFDPVLCDGTQDLLLKYDESHVSNQHKFGIIYQRENQTTEEDIFSNETPSIAMENFLSLIGKRVKLKDFRRFRGGLDVKSDQTGIESIYEEFQNHEIMFHVSTLLPYSKSERQQLERKRHIGNDIVTIVFQEIETNFNPECITSQFLHVYLVVTPLNPDGTQFKVSVIRRDNVPTFGPINQCLSQPFQCDQTFKNWMLTKLINAEIASCRASTIQKYQQRTKMTLFDNLYRTLHDHNRLWMNFVFSHSQYKHECDVEQQQQQREESQNYSSSKSSERHSDNSLLGSVRRRFIAPKLRIQNSNPDHVKVLASGVTSPVTTPASSNNNESRSKTRSMTMELRRSVSRESITTNGHNSSTNGNGGTRMTSLLSSSKPSSPRLDKSRTSRSLLDQDNMDPSTSGSRSANKFLSPATCPSSPWTSGPSNGFLSTPSSNELNNNGDSYSTSGINSSPQFISKIPSDDNHHELLSSISLDELQSSSKDDLIKYVLALQQKHQGNNAQVDPSYMKATRRPDMQVLQQQNALDRDSP